jgi:hypothetical protein
VGLVYEWRQGALDWGPRPRLRPGAPETSAGGAV